MAKEYKETHPWLSFELNLREFPPALWFDLGECVSKSDHLQRTPMPLELRQYLAVAYLSKGAAATTAIEGNTLGEEVVQKIVDGTAPPPRESYRNLHTEVENVLSIFQRIMGGAQDKPLPPLMPQTLHDFQADILRGLPFEGNLGKVRQRGVQVGTYRGAPHAECQHLLERLCEWLREGECFRQLQDEFGEKAAGIIRAVMTHLYIAWIHPYDDGNGRTARMAEFYLLVAAGFSDAEAHLLSNHCNKLRDEEYYRQLTLARDKQSPLGFICFMVRGLRDGLREQLQPVYYEHEKLVWRAVAEVKVTGSAAARARRVGLALLLHGKGESQSAEKLFADPNFAVLYAGQKSGVALMKNDLQKLVEVDIARKDANGFSANTALLRGLKPTVRAAV